LISARPRLDPLGYIYPVQLPLAVFPPGTFLITSKGLANLMVVRSVGSIDSRIAHALALRAASMSHRSRGLH